MAPPDRLHGRLAFSYIVHVAIPHTIPSTWPVPLSPARFASTIRTDSTDGCAIGLIGLADDLGVRLNGGRPGAREGPGAFRGALAKYGVADPHGWEWPRVFDAGDIVPAEGRTEAALHETHRRVSDAVGAMLDLGVFPVGIGGGHDLTFAFMRPVLARHGVSRVVYCDAHLDVREAPGSGMPFRALVEQCGVKRLEAFGTNDLVNSREHARWFESHGGVSARNHGDNGMRFEAQDCVLSLDLDVFDAGFAPGVSAPNPSGWFPLIAMAPIVRAGASRQVKAFDIMELCPAHDHDERTARLAAHVFLTFIRHFGARGEPGA